MSFLALEGFLIQTDFCKLELAGDYKPASTLTQFVDFILQTNADRWRDSLGFLSTGELSTYWASFHGARPKTPLLTVDRDNKNFLAPAAASSILGSSFAMYGIICFLGGFSG